jgi:hypothetical protein
MIFTFYPDLIYPHPSFLFYSWQHVPLGGIVFIQVAISVNKTDTNPIHGGGI